MNEIVPRIPPRDPIVLTRLETGEQIKARITMLTRRIASTKIFEDWWAGERDLTERYQKEPDRHWDWIAETEHADTDPESRRNYVVLTAANKKTIAQGAISLDFAGKSLLEPGNPAVYVKFLATHPRNRRQIFSDNATFGGVGRNLMMTAMMESLFARFEGRVLLKPLEKSVGFYEKLKFVRTLDRMSQSTYYEIERDMALSCLRKEGWV